MNSIIFYDTCALLTELKEAFKANEKFYISSVTLNELENIKTSNYKDEEIKYNARQLLHLLENNEDKYEVVLYTNKTNQILTKFNLPDTNDSKIIANAIECGNKTKASKIIFKTKDLACKAIAKAVGLSVEYITSKEEEYTGYKEVKLSEDGLANFYQVFLPENINDYCLLVNQYLIIKDENNKILDSYKWTAAGYKKVNFIKYNSKQFGKVSARNDDIYQQLALDSLGNNKITMIRGAAGTGKSYLSFGYMFHLLERGNIDKIIIFCNTVATKGSAKLGFYPGSRDEKLLDSQIGNLLASKLGDKMMVEKLIADGQLILLPMSDIRGYDTTNMNAAVYISEAQNLDIELMKLALQRIGEDSICILDGDSNAQVDMSQYAGSNNGMKRVSEVFRGSDIYGEVTLVNIQRSKIAELAQKM
jgi:predicted ribonuclease YlaK